jgi:formylglycine-generating enzyme required for sulfatase activity
LAIHDMSGNVWEWCEDVASTSYHRIRGGGWFNFADICTVADRGGKSPDSREFGFGFRLARSSGN